MFGICASSGFCFFNIDRLTIYEFRLLLFKYRSVYFVRVQTFAILISICLLCTSSDFCYFNIDGFIMLGFRQLIDIFNDRTQLSIMFEKHFNSLTFTKGVRLVKSGKLNI